MTWKLIEGTNNAKDDQGRFYEGDTGIMTLADGEKIQTLPVSPEAQEGAEEYMRILEGGESKD